MPRVHRRTNSAIRRTRRSTRFPWESWQDQHLLDLRLCDLGVSIKDTWLEGCIERLYGELEARELRMRPHCWLSDEWFSPAGVPGIAIPFYLAHPRLKRLEKNQMLEVEGGSRKECMKILRHETGHAIQSAYELQRRRGWQKHFGRSSQPYPEYYRPNPRSKRFVQHLDTWYAQSHPLEDFAETFAVWLTPRSNWRKRYEGWPASKKLEYTDELMKELADQKPKLRSRVRPDSLPRLHKTLRKHYAHKRERYSAGYANAFDEDLKTLFSSSASRRGKESAASFLLRNRREIRELVARWTGEYQFTLDQVLKEMIGRCRALTLRATGKERQLKLDFSILLTVYTMYYLYHGREWHPL